MSTAPSPTMEALRFRLDAPRYLLAGALGRRAPLALAPLRLERVALPQPQAGWRRVEVRLTGVCGSDLAVLFGKNSPRLSAFFSFPAVLGHEILGEFDGSRVVVNPVTSCRERSLPECDACRRGDDNLCANAAEGGLAPGLIGFNRDLPGGFGEALIAHEARLHAVGDDVPDDRAVLAEPFAVAWRAARLATGDEPGRLLVVGGGTIGLAVVAALRHRGFGGELHAVARYPRQAEAARAMGADAVHADAAGASGSVGGRSYASTIGPPSWRGGFDAVVDAGGSRSSLAAASWAAREGGKVVLVGAPGPLRHDFSPHWFREVGLVGSWIYSASEFAEATAELGAVEALDTLEVRRYPLRRYGDAIRHLRAREALKVALAPSS